MYAKSLLIPIAAFALSATGVSAFNPDILQKAGLTDDQISAFEDARELREEGNITKARDVLRGAGINVDMMESMRSTVQKQREMMRTAIEEAVAADNFESFKQAISHSPLSDIVTSKNDFELFKQAHLLYIQGQDTEMEILLKELGFAQVHKQHAFPKAGVASLW